MTRPMWCEFVLGYLYPCETRAAFSVISEVALKHGYTKHINAHNDLAD